MDSARVIKRIFTAIIAGILLLFIASMFYLTGLYNDISEETAGIISFCIEEADGEELQNRLTAISAMSNGEPATITVEKSVEGNGSNVSDMKKGKGAVVFSLLVKEVRQTVHHAVDTVMPPNLPMLDSLIAAGFRNKNISARLYYSEIIDMNTGNVIAASRRQEAGMKGNAFVYEYDTENGYAYKIQTSSMTLAALERMSGILLTTLLTALLLGYAFRFFIRTAVRQKTLEEMKQDFTNNMTHELKTPVSIAYSAVDALLNFRQGESAEKRRQYLNICIEQLSRLRDLIEQILSASMERSKNIVLKKENVALKPLFARIAEQQKLNIDKCVDIDILVQPENLTVYADATHLYNIVANLTDNAVKYSSESVKIGIKSYIDGKYCVIAVRDNGLGVSRENRKHIFDRFYRVPHGNTHNVKGYGLGLFYVRTMTERHKGTVSVKSEINKGSEFIIKLPVQ